MKSGLRSTKELVKKEEIENVEVEMRADQSVYMKELILKDTAGRIMYTDQTEKMPVKCFKETQYLMKITSFC